MTDKWEVHEALKAISLATDASQYDEILINNGQPFRDCESIDFVAEAFYDVYPIHKKSISNKMRIIQAPIPSLKRIQRMLLNDMKKCSCLHSCATAVSGKSFVDNATPHVGARHVFKTDILEFYPTVTWKKVQKTLQDYFPENLDWFTDRMALLFYRAGDLLAPHLPTGAPTSPFIGNLVLCPVDKEIQELAEREDGIYTRYLDDITISFRKDLNPVQMNDIKNTVCKILLFYHWQPHPRKTRWIDPAHDRFTVTGVDVRTNQKVTSKYIKQKVSSVIERNIQRVLAADFNLFSLPKSIKKKNKDQIVTFEDLLPIFFSESVHLLGYIKQVNKEQYKQQVDRLKYRLNYIGNLKTTPIDFTLAAIKRFNLVWLLSDSVPSREVLLEHNIQTFEEALIFSLKYLQDNSVLTVKDSTHIRYTQKLNVSATDELPF